MEVLDAKGLSERLRWEDNEYWLHLEAETPFEKYPAKQHARRVQEKLGVEEGLIYLPGQPARNNEDSDMPAPFRQRRYFYYLSGCNEPDCHLTYDTRRDELSLFIPRIKPERVIWYGRGSTLAEALVKYDVDQVFYADELEYAVQEWAIGNRQADIYVLHQSSQFPGCDNLKPRIDSIALRSAMNVCRMIKDDHEIKLIRKANDISSQAHREILANITNFKNEAQVEGLFMDVCISQQAKQQAYDPIAASGPNAGTLHYAANDEDLAGRQLIDPQSSHLEEGMVVTVEPGIYFSAYALQHFYLPSPVHSKYINTEVLKRYMPVGGVRIEDDILITSSGYENLTTAPKGDAMLEVIRHGKKSSVDVPSSDFTPLRRPSGPVEPTLRRAPGISTHTPSQHLQKPLARAATLPADFVQQRNSDFAPFAGPSLFSNFSRSMTTEEKIQQWQHKRSPVTIAPVPSVNAKQPNPVCGEMDPNFQHVYMSNASSPAFSSQSTPQFDSTPPCQNCAILVQTLDRLRQNLTSSIRSSSKPEVKATSEADLKSKSTKRVCDDDSTIPSRIGELSVGASACTVNLDKNQRIPLPPPQPNASRTGDTRAAQWARRSGAASCALPIRAQTLDSQISQAYFRGEESTDKVHHVSPYHQIRTTNGIPGRFRRRTHRKIPDPAPSPQAPEPEATRQKLESLQLRLDSLEEGARVKRRQQDQAVLPERFLASRPSMPVLTSRNPWQQHHRPTAARGSGDRPSTNMEGLDVDRSRLERLEESERQRRLERDALTRDTFFLR
ncbi:hypothetical protein J4E93_006687 [Alternaria ventricosa]|uniref:uncharacterized protein n=1 Tax=Alternaria ventricosa TaxID=1187951 RepID=UPI0020C2BA76|nr:uncharacterized protein J4E93_006687 [Alternaria ventricosa]KAI4643675.1 hypothetical protein J4E93_006687 [Alternaria ventricosa]